MKAKNKTDRQRTIRYCVRCRNHGFKFNISGHKSMCNFKNCYCDMCTFSRNVNLLASLEKKNHKTSENVLTMPNENKKLQHLLVAEENERQLKEMQVKLELDDSGSDNQFCDIKGDFEAEQMQINNMEIDPNDPFGIDCMTPNDAFEINCMGEEIMTNVNAQGVLILEESRFLIVYCT